MVDNATGSILDDRFIYVSQVRHDGADAVGGAVTS
jgi:hypothetical protein